MSNEYKDWFDDRIVEEKEIIAKYPFLQARDLDGSIDTNSDFPMLFLEIPNGWYKLFYQMCDDIKDLVPEDFYFLQVKEKYNFLRCYSANSTLEVDAIIAKYENMARFVCTICGKPAIFETNGYITSFCDDCWKNLARHEKGTWITFRPYYRVIRCSNKNAEAVQISFEEEWNRYIQS